MNVRILSCGVIGGLLAAYTLSFPLYIVLPTRYTQDVNALDWGRAGGFGYLLTVLVGVATGYATARWDWQTTPRGRLNSGALAGLIAGLVAYPLIGAPAAAVASQAPVWLIGKRAGPFPEAEATAIVVDCVLRAAWFPFLMFWAMLAGITLLGALGGLLAVFDPAARPWGTAPPQRVAASGFDSSVSLMVMGSLILLVCLSAITTLETNAEKSIARFGMRPGLPAAGITACPVGMTLVILIVSTWFCGHWCANRWNHPIDGVRRVARLAAVIMVFLPVMTVGLAALISPRVFEQAYFLLGEALWFGVMLFWLARIKFRPGPESAESAAGAPTFRDRLILNACFIGVITPALNMAAGVCQAVALALGVVPYIPVLFAKTPVPVEQLPHAGQLILNLYAVHVWGACGMAAVWVVAALIHAGVVLALPALWKARQAAAAQQPWPASTTS